MGHNGVRFIHRELRYAFKLFAPHAQVRKVTMFGSARTLPTRSEYQQAIDFARKIAAEGWMIITGAGPGIMQAGHEGAGPEKSFGANIRLPWEQAANPIIQHDKKLPIIVATRAITAGCPSLADKRSAIIDAIRTQIESAGLQYLDLDGRIVAAVGARHEAEIYGFGANLGFGHLNVVGNRVYGEIFADVIAHSLPSQRRPGR